jgi:hypothetical protein
MSLFDTQAKGLDKAADETVKEGPPGKGDNTEDPKSQAEVEQFNQHILLTAQAINRLRTNLFVGG